MPKEKTKLIVTALLLCALLALSSAQSFAAGTGITDAVILNGEASVKITSSYSRSNAQLMFAFYTAGGRIETVKVKTVNIAIGDSSFSQACPAYFEKCKVFLTDSSARPLCSAVTAEEGVTAPTVKVESKTVRISDGTVKVDISVLNNPCIASMVLDVSYDSALSLTNVSLNTSAFGENMTAAEPYKNPQRISFASPLSEVGYSGRFATLTFKIANGVTEDCTANISVSYDEDNVFDGNLDNVHFDVINGTINIVK